ncbi:hypothetical protein [Flagellimonas nanhaiensis]|uniref:EF-hand domain-containing protein n=1 Tax=Flagellimonas nanhaiensis TaxID=2292706 RepID=A0A371JS90_9FLAO|nr:hypothetical protein [Allomuricauda nanhaiensis]RDY60656.1 hypothetical protein DX873_00295 [Allomuricauda nanhaiensis]
MLGYNEIGILLGLFAVLIILLARKKVQNPYARSIWRSALLCFAFYAAILIIVEIRWHYLKQHALSFDLDQNGFVDLHEYTEEAKEAMNRITMDTARGFAFLTAAALSSIIAFAFLVSDLTVTHLRLKKTKKNTYE